MYRYLCSPGSNVELKFVSFSIFTQISTTRMKTKLKKIKFSRSKHRKSPSLSMSHSVPESKVMSSILRTRSPLSTYPNFCRQGPTGLRRTVTRDQYLSAANNLEALGLGCTLTITKMNRKCVVFVKKRPDEVEAILKSNEDLCSTEEYANRFGLAIPADILKFNHKSLHEVLLSFGYENFIETSVNAIDMESITKS